MSCRTKTSAAKLTGKITQKGENVVDNSSQSPTTLAECAVGVHPCVNILKTRFATAEFQNAVSHDTKSSQVIAHT